MQIFPAEFPPPNLTRLFLFSPFCFAKCLRWPKCGMAAPGRRWPWRARRPAPPILPGLWVSQRLRRDCPELWLNA
jgi:hypothetical protein